MFDINKYHDEIKHIVEKVYYSNQAMIRFTTDHNEGTAWILANKEKLDDLPEKFTDVGIALKGEFTKGYAGALGVSIIKNHILSSLKEYEDKKTELRNGFNTAIEDIRVKLDALSRETNTVIYPMILGKIKENKTYKEYVSETLKSNYKSISKYIQNSNHPERDLSLIPTICTQILKASNDFFINIDKVYKNYLVNHKVSFENVQEDIVELDSLVFGNDDNIFSKLDIKSMLLKDTDIETLMEKRLSEYPNGDNILGMLDAVESLLNGFKEPLVSTIEANTNTASSTIKAVIEKDNTPYVALSKEIVETYEKAESANEDYDTKFEYYYKLMLGFEQKLVEYCFIAYNNLNIINNMINVSSDSYNAISKSFKIAE